MRSSDLNLSPGADAKYIYAVAKHKALLEVINKVRDKSVELSGCVVKFRGV